MENNKEHNAMTPEEKYDAWLLEEASDNWKDFDYLAALARKAKSEKVRDQILEMERRAWKRYDLCEFYD